MFTFEEFETIVNNVALNQPDGISRLSNYASTWDDSDGYKIENGKIIQIHVSGGAKGGNCWGDSAERFSNHRSPQPFYPLDNILRETAPNLSYLKYKEIENLIILGEDSDHEYYGNYTDYDTFTLDIRQLYDTLFPKEG